MTKLHAPSDLLESPLKAVCHDHAADSNNIVIYFILSWQNAMAECS